MTPKVFYTSDLHIGHKMVAGIRGYRDSIGDPDTSAHDEAMAEVWDSQVKYGDIVYVLGDISISGNQYVMDWFSRRREYGPIHLISGNHDPVHPMHRTATKYLQRWSAVFDSIQPFLRRRLNGVEFLLSHFPYASWGDGDREGSRFDQYRLPDLGMPLLHGHTHGLEQGHGHSLHVGIDAWHRLVPQDIVIDWLNSL